MFHVASKKPDHHDISVMPISRDTQGQELFGIYRFEKLGNGAM
jgi:hypothetical protein